MLTLPAIKTTLVEIDYKDISEADSIVVLLINVCTFVKYMYYGALICITFCTLQLKRRY